ncbi:MAG: SLC13/DASS family transporter [Candidatus Omnitrophica bacterium]|nr:SLC13/DASS family transporter [Candidatus Omnitrophota bacterium]MCB9721939.1 SLC13/DASS family transporter [Candidatus Omnitrophota bacterium]
MKKWIGLIAGITVPLLILSLPREAIPITGLTLVEQRLLAIFSFAVIFWIMEPIPVFSASVLIIFLQLLLISDKGLIWFRQNPDVEGFGKLVPHKALFHTFAEPIILLFLGGFFLAMAATKYRLDVNLARVMLKPFGRKPAMVMLGIMLITAMFSMFMSNTATTAMMLAILAPVLALFDADDPARIGIALSVPFAANVGGLGTPIGTPPNAVAMKYLTGDLAVSFGGWMGFALPYVIVLLLLTWLMLSMMFKAKSQEVQLEIKGRFMRSREAIAVYVTFAATILLWLFGSKIGLNSYVVALVPVAVFTASGIITAGDMKKMSWDVLWLVSGGLALGVGLEQTGLSEHLVASIPFDQFPPHLIVCMAVMLCILMGTFMSHTATANLVLPIIAALGMGLASLEPLGGAKMLVIASTFGCSLAMALPISTPPNALAYATNFFETKNMIKAGLAVNVIGLTLVFVMLFVLNQIGYF